MVPSVALRAPCVAICSGILSAKYCSIGILFSDQRVGQIWAATMGHFSVAISNSFIGTMELLLGRKLKPQKPGHKKKDR